MSEEMSEARMTRNRAIRMIADFAVERNKGDIEEAMDELRLAKIVEVSVHGNHVVITTDNFDLCSLWTKDLNRYFTNLANIIIAPALPNAIVLMNQYLIQRLHEKRGKDE